jgi:uncharacterized protein with HEPN domain
LSRRDDFTRLRHKLDHANEAVEMAHGLSVADLARDRRTQLAIIHLIGIVGEAANRVSKETAAGIPEIPWALVVGMRNRLIHGYDRVDLEVLERTVRMDLPPMIAVLRGAVAGMKGE